MPYKIINIVYVSANDYKNRTAKSKCRTSIPHKQEKNGYIDIFRIDQNPLFKIKP